MSLSPAVMYNVGGYLFPLFASWIALRTNIHCGQCPEKQLDK